MSTGTVARTTVTNPPIPWPTNWPASCVFPRLGAVATAPRDTRATVRATLRQWGLDEVFGETAELLASELVTNVVDQSRIQQHATTPELQVALFADRSRVLIGVWDKLTGAPVLENAGDEDEHGRGLCLASLLGDLGWLIVPGDGGKIVHVTITAESITRASGL